MQNNHTENDTCLHLSSQAEIVGHGAIVHKGNGLAQVGPEAKGMRIGLADGAARRGANVCHEASRPDGPRQRLETLAIEDGLSAAELPKPKRSRPLPVLHKKNKPRAIDIDGVVAGQEVGHRRQLAQPQQSLRSLLTVARLGEQTVLRVQNDVGHSNFRLPKVENKATHGNGLLATARGTAPSCFCGLLLRGSSLLVWTCVRGRSVVVSTDAES